MLGQEELSQGHFHQYRKYVGEDTIRRANTSGMVYCVKYIIRKMKMLFKSDGFIRMYKLIKILWVSVRTVHHLSA
jgi:hypothetical protein